MSQMPPQGYPGSAPYSPPPTSQTNGWAIASLVCGLLGCAFGVTGLLGFIFGIFGIKKAKEVGSGMAMAVAGMIVGLVFILGWGGCGGAAYWAYQKTFVPTRNLNTAFLNDLSQGNLTHAKSVTSSGFSDADMALLATQIKPLGNVKHVQITQFNQVPGSASNGTMAFDVGGVIEFDNGQKTFSETLVGTLGNYRIDDLKLR